MPRKKKKTYKAIAEEFDTPDAHILPEADAPTAELVGIQEIDLANLGDMLVSFETPKEIPREMIEELEHTLPPESFEEKPETPSPRPEELKPPKKPKKPKRKEKVKIEEYIPEDVMIPASLRIPVVPFKMVKEIRVKIKDREIKVDKFSYLDEATIVAMITLDPSEIKKTAKVMIKYSDGTIKTLKLKPKMT